MKKITIAFDVDGTLISNLGNPTLDTLDDIVENEKICDLLYILSKFKNTKIIVWSGRGKEWAEAVTKVLMLSRFVDGYASKNHKGKDDDGNHIFEPDFTPDIAIDDIQACDLGLLNLIVKEK